MNDKTKAGYHEYSDHIWKKRHDSPNALRRYVHRRQYYAFLPHVRADSFVLDAGSGEGVLTYHLSPRCYRIVAMDISRPNVFNSRKILAAKGRTNVLFVVGDAENLPFKDHAFDVVASCHVLEHIPDFDKGLRELHRVTQSRAVIAVPTCLNLCSAIMIGGESFWCLTRHTPFALLKGLGLVLLNLCKAGVYEKYAGRNEFPHLWQYPWFFTRRLARAGFKLKKLEASTIALPVIAGHFPVFLLVQRVVDKLRGIFPFNWLGYGTTVVVEK